ncbi:MAG: cell division protein ZapD [Gammaproteobacteria bacterium]
MTPNGPVVSSAEADELPQDAARPSRPPLAARGPLVYEQPLNERMRNFLRLEFLYRQACHHNDDSIDLPDAWATRAAVTTLLDLMAITARGDTRTDVLKELDRQIGLLREFQSRPGVDAGRLRAVVATLTERREALHAAGSNFLQRLRDNEFLSAVKHRSTIPGGTCEFDLPAYTHWLGLPAAQRQREFESWLSAFRPLCDSVADLLWVTRENARPRHETAFGGQFHITFERDQPLQLLRIAVPAESELYPEVSGNQIRCSIRFLRWGAAGQRPTQAVDNVEFVLTCCH